MHGNKGADNLAAIQATRRVGGASGYHLVDRIYDPIVADRHKHAWQRIKLRWIPGHEGVEVLSVMH